MKALISTVSRKYEQTGDLAKVIGLLVFCGLLSIGWLFVLAFSGL